MYSGIRVFQIGSFKPIHKYINIDNKQLFLTLFIYAIINTDLLLLL